MISKHPQLCQNCSRKMENVVSKLDRIAEELAEVLSKFSEKRFEKVIEERESIISLYRYNDMHPSLLVSNEDIHESYDHALSLHLAMERGEFYVHTEKGPLSFSTDHDTIVVTVGEQLMVCPFSYLHFIAMKTIKVYHLRLCGVILDEMKLKLISLARNDICPRG